MVALHAGWQTGRDRGVWYQLTTSCEDSAMYSSQVTAVCQVQSADDIAANGGLFVVFAPVDVWSARHSRAVEDMGWFLVF